MKNLSQKHIIIESEDKPIAEYFTNWNQDTDIHPNQLSGDQNATKSLLVASGIAEASRANFGLTVTTIVKTVIGSGILSMPYTINKMGWVLGSIIFIMAGLLNQFSSILLLKAKNLSRHSNYSSIFYSIWKNKVAKGLGSLIIFVNNTGICIAEIIILKSSIRGILIDILGEGNQHLDQFYTSEVFLAILVSLLQLPITLVKKIEKLRFMALSGALGISIFMITFTIFYIQASLDSNTQNNPVGNMRAFPADWFKAAAAVPNIILALGYQMNIFPIFKGMKKASDSRMTAAVAVSLALCTMSYLLVGILGYNYVGNTVGANFLNYLSYDKLSRPYYFIIKISFLISVYFAFPLMFFGSRNNFIALIQLMKLKTKDIESSKWRQGDEIEHISSYIQEDQVEVRKKRANFHFVVYTLGIYLCIIGVGIGVDDIEAVFNVLGALCSSSICVLLPCFFYSQLIKMRKQRKSIKYYLSWVILIVMTPYAIFSVVSLYVTQ